MRRPRLRGSLSAPARHTGSTERSLYSANRLRKSHGSSDRRFCSIETPHLRSVGGRALADAREIREQEPRCLDRIVPSRDSHNKCELCLYERRKLGSLSEHARVRGDEAVPRVGVMVEGEQELPIIER
jgi:hypothetical protein